MMQKTTWVLAVVGAVLAACPFSRQADLCSTEAVAGLRILVKDVNSGSAICDATVRAVSSGGTETLTAQPGEGCPYVGAHEAPGTYRVEVEKTGYAPTAVDNVTVRQGDCHVETEDRTVFLGAS